MFPTLALAQGRLVAPDRAWVTPCSRTPAPAHLTPPDLQATLNRPQQPIGVAVRIFDLQLLEQLTSRSRRVGVEPGSQLRRHRNERVRPAPAARLLRLGLRGGPDLPVPPGRPQPRQKRLDRWGINHSGPVGVLIGKGRRWERITRTLTQGTQVVV